MATRDDIYSAIRTADKAGDSASVQKLAAYLKTMPEDGSSLHDQIAAKVDADPISQGAMNFAKDMPWYQQFGAGYGKAGADMALGLRQVAGKLPDQESAGGWLARSALGAIPGGGLIGAMKPATQGEVDETKRLDAPLTHTGWGLGGNLIGAVADTAPAMLIPGANAVAGAATTGAVLGAAQPVATDESRLKNAALGGVLGGGGAVVGRVVGAGARAVKAAAEPFTKNGPDQIAGRTLARFATDPNSISKATGIPTATGALPTLAEQTGDVGIARLQDALGAAEPRIGAALELRAAQNNKARVDKLREMAGEGGGRDFAVTERAGTAGPMYEDAFKVIPDAKSLSPAQQRTMQTLMKSPAIQAALKDAKTIAANKGTNVGPSNASGSIEGMHNMKLSMDDAIAKARDAGLINKADSIQTAQKKLVSLMEEISPEYANARGVYRDMSAPINQMDIAATLLKKGASNTTDLTTNAPRLYPDAFIGQLNNPQSLIKTATGRDLGKTLGDVMTPEQTNLIGTIGNELDRAAAVGRAGNGPGSATAQRLASKNILSQIVAPSVIPAGTKPTLAQKAGQAIAENTLANTVVGKATNWMYSGIAEPKIQEALAKTVLSPAEAQRALDAAAKASVKLPETLRQRLLLQAAQQTPAAVNRSSNP